MNSIENFVVDIRPLLQADGEEDQEIFFINQVFDVAKNTAFQLGLANSSDVTQGGKTSLTLDVKFPNFQ